jgi:hypothetical protein
VAEQRAEEAEGETEGGLGGGLWIEHFDLDMDKSRLSSSAVERKPSKAEEAMERASLQAKLGRRQRKRLSPKKKNGSEVVVEKKSRGEGLLVAASSSNANNAGGVTPRMTDAEGEKRGKGQERGAESARGQHRGRGKERHKGKAKSISGKRKLDGERRDLQVLKQQKATHSQSGQREKPRSCEVSGEEQQQQQQQQQGVDGDADDQMRALVAMLKQRLPAHLQQGDEFKSISEAALQCVAAQQQQVQMQMQMRTSSQGL